jgi:aldehyde:ferredoxin oxidoreductase
MKAGERIYNLMRAYIVREGLTRKDDDFPARFYDEPIPDGPTKGASLSRDSVAKELDAYYDIVGWDKVTGIPTKEKLLELDLVYVADELTNMGHI